MVIDNDSTNINNKQELGSDTEDEQEHEQLKDNVIIDNNQKHELEESNTNENNTSINNNTFQSEKPQIDNTMNTSNNNSIQNMVSTIKLNTEDIDLDDETDNTNNTNDTNNSSQSSQNNDDEKAIIETQQITPSQSPQKQIQNNNSKPILQPEPTKRRSARIAKKSQSQSMDIDSDNDTQMKTNSKSKPKPTKKRTRGRKRTVKQRDNNTNNDSISEPPTKKPRRSRRLSSNKKTKSTKSPIRSRSTSRRSKRFQNNSKKVIILWTGPDTKNLQSKLKQLGAKILSDYNKTVTHLITTQPRRTKKFISGMGTAEYIVTDSWANQCIKKKTFDINENKYLPKNKMTKDFEKK
eukprot:460996_1